MRIATNYCFPYGRTLPALVAVGWALALSGLAAAVFLISSGAALRSEMPGLRNHLQDEKKEMIPAEPAGSPKAPDLADLKGRLAALNRLGAGEGPSAAALLAQLEPLAPPGVRLVSFQNDRDTLGAQLVAEARNLEDLSRFLEGLEKSDSFSKVNLTKQTRVPDGSANWIQFSVDLTENPQ